MSETGPPIPDREPTGDGRPQASPRPGIFDDPVVRRMAIIASGLVVLFLATVVGVLVSGVVSSSGPRTVAERNLAVSRAAVAAGSTDSAEWGTYIAALINAGQYSRARSVITEGRASIEDSVTAEFTLAEARLSLATGDDEGAIEAALRAQEQIEADWEALVASGSSDGRWAEIRGYHDNYYISALVKAEALENLGRWAEAVEAYDLYIERNRGAADILVDRGNAKIEIGDTQGAEADFREALRFFPDSSEALEGLERIGVER